MRLVSIENAPRGTRPQASGSFRPGPIRNAAVTAEKSPKMMPAAPSTQMKMPIAPLCWTPMSVIPAEHKVMTTPQRANRRANEPPGASLAPSRYPRDCRNPEVDPVARRVPQGSWAIRWTGRYLLPALIPSSPSSSAGLVDRTVPGTYRLVVGILFYGWTRLRRRSTNAA
jgi:hypothetical protein